MAKRGENGLIVVAGAISAVTNAVIAGIVEEIAKGENLVEIFGATLGLSGLIDGKIVDLGAQSRKTINGLRRTPGSCLAGRSRDLEELDASALINALKEREIGTIFVVGDVTAVETLRYLQKTSQEAGYSLHILGVPVSSENEVAGGDHTPGYGSAARYVVSATRDAARAAFAGIEPIVVLEVPGSPTGWLAAATALATERAVRDENGRDVVPPLGSAPHAMALPERSVDPEAIVDETRRAYQKYGFAVVVTTPTSTNTEGDWLDGQSLADRLSEELGVPARYDRPGILVRMSQNMAPRSDTDEAYNAGALAVRLAGDDCTEYLVTVQRDQHAIERGDRGYHAIEGTIRLDQMEDETRPLPEEYIAENGLGVTQAFLDWARPLLGGGLPEYTNLS